MTEYRVYKARVDDMIAKFISETEAEFRPYVQYALEGGKRIRSVIALSMMDAARKGLPNAVSTDADDQTAMTCLCAELAHASSLILDDLPCMDNSKVRRMKPCMHVQYGESVALLTAAHLLTTAIRLYCRAYASVSDGQECAMLRSKAFMYLIDHVSASLSFTGASGGQLIDLQKVRMRSLEDAILRKTSSFFEIAFLTGYVMGNMLAVDQRCTDTHIIDRIRAAALDFGMAFQIYDDFGDIHEDPPWSNYVSTHGSSRSTKEFDERIQSAIATLTELGVYTHVIGEIVTMMKVMMSARV